MAVEVRVSRGYAWRMIIIAVVSLVFGLWGVYDYVYGIPRAQQQADRLDLLRISKDALETQQPRGQLTPEAKLAHEAVFAELNRVLQHELAESGSQGPTADPDQFREAVAAFREQLQASGDLPWVGLLATIGDGLMAERGLILTEENYPRAYAAYTQSQTAIKELDDVTAPGKYDRATQWAFISCRPCVPYFVWMFLAARRRLYRLDDDGTLHTPDGTWARSDIANIDMGRWMAKSIAWVVHSDGTRIKLDDYKFRDLHLIIGSIASRLRPTEWTAEAKPIDQKTDAATGAEEPAATASTDAG